MSLETDEGRLRRALDDGLTIGPLHISSDSFWGWLLVSPVLALYLLIAILPVCFAIYASLHAIPLRDPVWTYIGLQNYGTVLEIDRFWESLWRGVVYMVGSTVVQTIAGVWMALVLNKISRKRLLGSLVFSIYLTPTIVIILIATFLLDPFLGWFHIIGADTLGLWDGYLLGDTTLAMPVVILIGSWKFSVFITIFALAQLQSIPARFYEAAKICGATSLEMFRDITLPRIKGALLVAILLRSIFMFNKFDVIWPLTQGGPGFATTTMPILAYRETFVGGAYGIGNTIAIVMFLFLAAGGMVYFWQFNPAEEVET